MYFISVIGGLISPTKNAELGLKITDKKYITTSAFLFGDFMHFYFGGDNGECYLPNGRKIIITKNPTTTITTMLIQKQVRPIALISALNCLPCSTTPAIIPNKG